MLSGVLASAVEDNRLCRSQRRRSGRGHGHGVRRGERHSWGAVRTWRLGGCFCAPSCSVHNRGFSSLRPGEGIGGSAGRHPPPGAAAQRPFLV